MTNVLQIVLKKSFQGSSLLSKCVIRVGGVKTLYSSATLGIDKFLETRENIRRQLQNISSKFKDKMKQFTYEDPNCMIFTEDLKNMIHLAESNEDVELVVNMMKKFNQQNKELRFGNFIFGPVAMRMFFFLNNPDKAVECFKSTELQGFFDQLITYQILFDLLYENNKYSEMLDLFKVVQEKQVQGTKFPKNTVVLVFAACFKLNTPESYNYAKQMWHNIKEVGHLPLRRTVTFFAGLALKQGHPEEAIEILSTCTNSSYTTVRNIKVCALSELGRFEDSILLLKSILNADKPANVGKVHTFNRDVIEKVKNAIGTSGSEELKVEMDRVVKYLQEEGHISDTTLDEQLCSEIVLPNFPRGPSRPEDRYRNKSGAFSTPRATRSVGGLSRPGLSEIA